ncbi:MAG: hypothetical protein M1818_006093 [Claussenomyces sp. TS43310]|nr:MAG: hypothetical protein M1818_006093 [Claussenomyces sp. TS43310]
MAVDTAPTQFLGRSANGHERNSSLPEPSSKGYTARDAGHSNEYHSLLDTGYSLANQDNMQEPLDAYQVPSPSPSPLPSHSILPLFETSSADAEDAERYVSDHEPSRVSEDIAGIHHEGGQAILQWPKPISKTLSPHELPNIPEEKRKSRHKFSLTKSATDEKVLKLSPSELEELTSAPESLPITFQPVSNGQDPACTPILSRTNSRTELGMPEDTTSISRRVSNASESSRTLSGETGFASSRPGFGSRTTSTPTFNRNEVSWGRSSGRKSSPSPRPLRSGSRQDLSSLNSTGGKASGSQGKGRSNSESESDLPAQALPLPPMSIPTYLQLEMASTQPSPLYIHRSVSEYPYESSRIKFERLLNFLLLPPQLEQVLCFGALACLDAWLATFTILPLRFLKAIAILGQWWLQVLVKEGRFITGFIYHGAGRMWHRQRDRSWSYDSGAPRSRSGSRSSHPSLSATSSYQVPRIPEGVAVNGSLDRRRDGQRTLKSTWEHRHKRTRSQPSTLSIYNKADLLQGFVVIFSCAILMSFDASRMYHSIRGQSAMKLYVLYNVLEVVDRLFAALGQDIFECLTCDETLNRGADGRSKLLRPFGMFILALIYNVIHAAALFYQVVTLNVAVNSYSNALLSLLMSNQFVEIKGTVFKKFEKENLFQLTCADVVERFQLLLMLVIIGMRNVVEVGGLSLGSSPLTGEDIVHNATVPLRNKSMLPNSFTILPAWTGEVLSPFLVVIGSEMLVDWVKHAYISKFNCVKPAVYQKYLDVLAKDYYTNAFVNQNLIKRLGLPVIPLSCLFIRASVQTYHMFVAVQFPPPIPSAATALSVESATSSPTAAALDRFDTLIRKALGRSTFGAGATGPAVRWYVIDMDDVIAFITMLTFFLGAYLILLACKLVLGMLLLSFARNRYQTIKDREHLSLDTKGKRLGGWGMVEVDDDKKRRIYEDDPEGMKGLREREKKAAEKAAQADLRGVDFGRVTRYEMAAKRIW